MEKIYDVIGVVDGSHYVLSYAINFDKRENAQKTMVSWKNQHNENLKHPYSITAKIGESIDVIRVDTIKKMYIKTR